MTDSWGSFTCIIMHDKSVAALVVVTSVERALPKQPDQGWHESSIVELQIRTHYNHSIISTSPPPPLVDKDPIYLILPQVTHFL